MKKVSDVFKSIRFAVGEPQAMQEDLRNWFNPNHPKGGWKRVNSKGEVVGDCAREPGEPKPKCMSNAQRASLSKKEKASAVRRKRQEDPNPERQGAPINVTSKVNENMEQLNEKNKPTNPELWSRAIAQAKSKFDVYPSAYANGWASKWYKSKGGGWKTVSEAKEKSEYDYEGDMARGQLQSIVNNAQRVHDMLEDNDNLPEWVQSKITLAEDYISTVANYMMSEVDEEVEHIEEKISVVRGQAPRQQGRFAPNNQIRTDKTSIGRVVSGTQYTGTRKPKLKNEETVQEGRQSQRHPLEGHEYHKKSDEALVHIAKDAHKAAEAMKSHNTTAENKYRDQANDSATVRYYRQKHGMADWYKKKYGHIKEEVVAEGALNELSKDTLKSYAKKAVPDMQASQKRSEIEAGKAASTKDDETAKTHYDAAKQAKDRTEKRMAGISGAIKRVTNQGVAEALSPAIRMQMAVQKAREDRERSERNGEAALAGKFSSGSAKQPMKNPSLVSPKNEQVMDEPNYNNSIQARQKKADEKLPFDEPTRKAMGKVKDKSGAVHTPMSRTKDIAKKAARRQAGIKEAADVNDPLDRIDTEAKRSLSKTAGMVKDLATNAKSKAKEKAKKDTFEAEPELSSQIVKQ